MNERVQEPGESPGSPSQRAEEARIEFLGGDFDADEAAYVIGMDRATVLRYLRSGQIRGYRLGREWRIPRQALLDFRDRLIQEESTRHRFALLSRARGNRGIGTACCPGCGCLGLVTWSDRDGWCGRCGLCDEQFWASDDQLVERGGGAEEPEAAGSVDNASPGCTQFDDMPF